MINGVAGDPAGFETDEHDEDESEHQQRNYTQVKT